MATKIVAQVLKEHAVWTKGCSMISLPYKPPVGGYGYIKTPIYFNYISKSIYSKPVLQHNWITTIPRRSLLTPK